MLVAAIQASRCSLAALLLAGAPRAFGAPGEAAEQDGDGQHARGGQLRHRARLLVDGLMLAPSQGVALVSRASRTRWRIPVRARCSALSSAKSTKPALAPSSRESISKASWSDVDAGFDLSAALGVADHVRNVPEPVLEEVADPLLDASVVGVELCGGGGEEAATGEDPSLEVRQEGVGEGEDPCDALGVCERGTGYLAHEDVLGLVDGGELELLLRVEVGVEAAAGTVGTPRHSADRGVRLPDRERRAARRSPQRIEHWPGRTVAPPFVEVHASL